MTLIRTQVQPVQWVAGGGARHVSLYPAGRVRAGTAEPAAEVRVHGGRAAGGHETHLAHAGHGSVHGVHARAVRRARPPAAGRPVQPVDVQRAGVHARGAADPRVAGRRVPAAAQLQHEVLRVAEHQVPDRRGAPVRHQSLPPGPGRSGAAPGGRRRVPGAARRQRPRHDAVGGLSHTNMMMIRYAALHLVVHDRRRHVTTLYADNSSRQR